MTTSGIWHVGLLQRGRTAEFQYRRSVDYLSCEILQYFGKRETTKVAARARLQSCKAQVLVQLEKDYPGRFNNVVVS